MEDDAIVKTQRKQKFVKLNKHINAVTEIFDCERDIIKFLLQITYNEDLEKYMK